MKRKVMNKKLALNKSTVADLNNGAMNRALGGGDTIDDLSCVNNPCPKTQAPGGQCQPSAAPCLTEGITCDPLPTFTEGDYTCDHVFCQ